MNRDQQTNGRANPGATTVTTWSLPLDEHPYLDFLSDVASIALVPADDGVTRMFARTKGGEIPKVDVRAERGTTRVRVGLEGQHFVFWRKPAKLHLVLCVPEALRGAVRTGIGRIDAGRLRACALELSAEAGSMRVEDTTGALKLQTKTGRIQGLGVSGSLHVQSSAGKVELHVERLDPGTHRVRTYVGAIEAYLAPGADVRVEATAHIGRADVRVPLHPSAPALLAVETHLGAIRIAQTTNVAGDRRGYRAPSPPSESADSSTEADEVDRIVQLVVAGRITLSEAEDLLSAIDI